MTPFVTGVPYTLYMKDKIASGGLFGVVLRNVNTKSKSKINLEYPGLKPFGEPMKITSCRGNVILTLDEGSAARHLLSVTDEIPSVISQDHALYLEVNVPKLTGALTSTASSMGESTKVYRITSGDPSKGTLAVDTLKDLQEGMTVRVCIFSLVRRGHAP
jgi:small ligand-binding sensory domain FIST